MRGTIVGPFIRIWYVTAQSCDSGCRAWLGRGHWDLTSTRGAVISTIGWIAIGIAAWLAVAVLAGLLIGRVINRRERQAARDHHVHADLPPAREIDIPQQDTPARRVRASRTGPPTPPPVI